VVEQSFPNGNFTTCPYPNPEKNETLELGIRYAKENNADILLASDPDCDRVGTAVLNKGQYVILSGQEIGVLLTDFILCERTKSKTLTPDSVIVKSIVSTDLAKKVASGYGVKTIDVLTGFKYIGNIITELTASGHQNDFVFGFEESCGYLAGVYAHDKDAVVACMLLAQMCSAYKKRGLTLIDRLEQIYSKYGKFNHKTVSFSFGGSVGAEKMKNLMDKLRSDKLSEIEGLSIIGTQDLLEKVEFPVSADVLIYTLEGDCKVIVRPSGTEPLIKVYLTVKGNESLATKIMSKFVDFFNCYFD
ncbi:MAG: phospho-sugar mutase, partial [Clostridia bacterium]